MTIDTRMGWLNYYIKLVTTTSNDNQLKDTIFHQNKLKDTTLNRNILNKIQLISIR